jgi:outer membrane protein OmpA-like peptidoglycan-associated protein
MRLAVVLAAAVAAAGCAPTTRVILLPQSDGSASAVEVTSGNRDATVLSHPWNQAEVRGGVVAIEPLDAKTVQAEHARLLSVQPPVPERFVLYFLTGTSELTPESSAALAEVLAHATERPGGEILVIGHTDRVGKVEYNDSLSINRATVVRDMIVQRGFNPVRVYASGRGEREPIIPTADEVDEPKNRRVEILVR